jgi:hypothetical protein
MDTQKALSCINITDEDSCWNWTAAKGAQSGYGHFRSKNGEYEYAHRFAWEYFVGDIPDGLHVLHHCDNPPCCNPNHLFLGTHADNMHDRDKKGRGYLSTPESRETRRNKPPAGKLTKSQVIEIRSLYSADSCSFKDLAVKFDMSHRQIRRIVNRESWKHIK